MNPRDVIEKAILEKVFVSKREARIISPEGDESAWLFDFRKVMLQPEVLDAYATWFVESHKDAYPYQVCGLETAAVSLVAAIVMKSTQVGAPVNGFFIRKSRKKKGLLQIIEGEIGSAPIIIVDDLINTSTTTLQQLAVLDQLREEVEGVPRVMETCVMLQVNPASTYSFLKERNLDLTSLFKLEELADKLKHKGYVPPQRKEVTEVNVFDIAWSKKLPNPNHWAVFSKGGPLLHDGRVYLGSDDRVVYCFEIATGKEVFSYRVGKGYSKRRAFSKILPMKESIAFSSSDGNTYCIGSVDGKKKWISFDHDNTGGEMALDPLSNILVFHSMTGLWKRKALLVGVHADSGKTAWSIPLDESSLGNCTALKDGSCIVTTDKGSIFKVNMKNGTVLWHNESDLEYVCAAKVSGLQVIVAGLAHEDDSSNHSDILSVDLATGKTKHTVSVPGMFAYSSPCVHEGRLYVASADRYMYAFSADTLEPLWRQELGARVFSSPSLFRAAEGEPLHLYIGTNRGILMEIEPLTGRVVSRTFFAERITDTVYRDEHTGLLLMSTYANELYALKRKPAP